MDEEMNWSDALLTRADELLHTAGRCTGYYAVDEEGVVCGAGDPRAARFCMTGALQRAAYEMGIKTYLPFGPFQDALDKLERGVVRLGGGAMSLTSFNDCATDDKVEAAFQIALTGVTLYA